MKTLKVKLLTEAALIPTRAHPYDAGLDIYSVEDKFIPLGHTVKIESGIAVDILPGYYGQIKGRSSLASKGIETGAGVIDANYHGDLSVILHNLTYKEGYQIKKGDKMAQLIIHSIELPSPIEILQLDDSDRGTKSFGSSGR